jgi:hypothetical protein
MGLGIAKVERPFGAVEWGYDIGFDVMGGFSFGFNFKQPLCAE